MADRHELLGDQGGAAHQGTDLIPVDFIAALAPRHGLEARHRLLLANCIAQSKALMVARSSGHEA